MVKHRNLVGIAVMAAAVSVSACSSTTTSGSSATTTHPSGTNAAAPSGGSSSFCGALVRESSDAAKLSTNFSQSLGSGNFSTAQQTLNSYLAQVSQDLAKVESSMNSAPANVQNALQVINN